MARWICCGALCATISFLGCTGDEDTASSAGASGSTGVAPGSSVAAGSGASAATSGSPGATSGGGAAGGGSSTSAAGGTGAAGGAATTGAGGTISGDDLGDLANQMQPGTWAALTIGGIVEALASDTGSSGIVIHYSINGVWDPTTKCVYYAGSDHHGGDPAYGLLMTEYCASSGAWSQLGLVLDGGGTVPLHGYDHLSLDASSGVLYERSGGYQDGTVMTAGDSSPNAWSAVNPIPDAGLLQIAIASEWVPGKGLVVFNCGAPGGEVWLRNPSGMWSSVASGFGNSPNYHCAAEYSPLGDVVIFGGGNGNETSVWRLNADNSVTALADTPFSAGWGIQKYNAVTDPVTGKLLFMGGNPRELWELDPSGSGTWTLQTGARVPPSELRDPSSVSGPDGVISIPISTYGVVLYVSCYIGTCNAFLYKHA